MKRFVIILLCLLSMNAVHAQKVTNKAFKSGEKLRFVASYYMSSLWTDLAEINMEVSDVKTSSREFYRLKCTGKTYQSWDSFFKIRDLYESYVDKASVQPFLFKRSIDEGGYAKDIKYVYKWNSGKVQVTSQRRSKPEKKYEINLNNDTYDLVSVIYMIRSINFNTKKPGDIIKIKVLIDAKEEFIMVKYLGKEDMDVAEYGKKECYKLSVSLKDDRILKGKDTNNIWFTADKNKVPVFIKAEIPVGSIQLRLVEMSGLRN